MHVAATISHHFLTIIARDVQLLHSVLKRNELGNFGGFCTLEFACEGLFNWHKWLSVSELIPADVCALLGHLITDLFDGSEHDILVVPAVHIINFELAYSGSVVAFTMAPILLYPIVLGAVSHVED